MSELSLKRQRSQAACSSKALLQVSAESDKSNDGGSDLDYDQENDDLALRHDLSPLKRMRPGSSTAASQKDRAYRDDPNTGRCLITCDSRINVGHLVPWGTKAPIVIIFDLNFPLS
jgi:hypothetical protein